MGKGKRGRKAAGKDKARKPNTRRKNAGSKSSAPPKARKKEVYAKLAIRSRAKRCVEKQAHMEAARVECVRLGIGATKYLRHEKWGQQLPGCPLTWSDKSRLAANIKSGHTPRNGVHNMHLTPAEEADFAASIMPAAHRKQPFTWTEISEAVADTLDKRNLGPAGRLVPAVGSKVAQCVMNGRASWKWRSAFCGRTGVKDFNPEDLGHSRARASNEHAKYEHMRDLQEELVDSGVMASNDDPRILDTRRIANLDEVPQVMNARANAGNAKERVAGMGGRLILIISLSLIISRALCIYLPPSLLHPTPPSLTGGDHMERVFQQAGEGRETNTVEICYDLGGFLYGVHILLARKTLDTNVIDEEALRSTYDFDNTVDERMGMCWRCDISTCECGIQTEETLASRMGFLRLQVVARNKLCVVKGKEPIEFPIAMCLNNHSSRFGTKVHKALYTIQEGGGVQAGNWTGKDLRRLRLRGVRRCSLRSG